MNIFMIVNVALMLVVAVCMDVRDMRIPNLFNGLWCVYGSLYSVLALEKGALYSLMGIGIPVVGLMVLFAMGAIGAGDIKLLAAVGSFVGIDIIWVIVYSFVLCGGYGVFLLVRRMVKALRGGQGRRVFALLICRGLGHTRVAFSIFIGLGFVWYVVDSILGGVEIAL